jgi:hypothetical protein
MVATVTVSILDGPHEGRREARLPGGVQPGDEWELSHLFVLDNEVSAAFSGDGVPADVDQVADSYALDARTWVYERAGSSSAEGHPEFHLIQPGSA